MDNSKSIIELKKWVYKEINPNTYAVLTVKQAIYANWLVKGDRIIYERAFKVFIRGLTKRVFGCNNYKKRLFYLATLEGGDAGRFHINLCIRRPDWLLLDDFRKMISDEWQKLEWAMPQIYVEDRYADCVGYSLKEGSDALLACYNESADSQGVLFKSRQRRRSKRTWKNQGALTRLLDNKKISYTTIYSVKRTNQLSRKIGGYNRSTSSIHKQRS